MLYDLYTALEAGVVSVNGADVPVLAFDDLLNGIPSANLPVRLMLPFGNRGGGGQVEFPRGIGRGTQELWRLTDLFLYEPVPQDRGLPSASGVLVQYVDDYVEMVRTGVVWPECAEVESVNFLVGPTTFGLPDYWSVEATITVAVLT